MEIQSITTQLFETFASVWVNAVREISSVELEIGRPTAEQTGKEAAGAKAPERGVIAAVPVVSPAPGVIILFIPLPFGAIIPEKIIAPESQGMPDHFSELHRSAMEELASQAWTEAAPEITSKIGKPFKTAVPEIALDSLSNYIKNLPAMMGIQNVVTVEFPARIGPGNFTIIMLAPADFLTALFQQEEKHETVRIPVSAAGGGRELKSLEVEQVEKTVKAADGTVKKKLQKPPAADKTRRGPDRNLEVMLDIPVTVTIELGRTKLPVANLLNLAPGTVIGLDTLNGAPIRVLVNEHHVAGGQVVTIGEKFGVRVVNMVAPEKRLEDF